MFQQIFLYLLLLHFFSNYKNYGIVIKANDIGYAALLEIIDDTVSFSVYNQLLNTRLKSASWLCVRRVIFPVGKAMMPIISAMQMPIPATINALSHPQYSVT